ncbi:MAG: DnaD domain protein [Oscillospiraceae bacterium]
MATCLIPGGVLSLSCSDADKLFALGSGDGALLYLALLRYDTLPAARAALKWGLPRLEGAYAALVTAGLATAGASSNPEQAPPVHDAPPDYMMADIAGALEKDGTFSSVSHEVERLLGKLLSGADLKTLYEIYDYIALPADVILLLTNFCLRETVRKYGEGRKPRMSVISKTAYKWQRLGLDTPEAVEEFLKGQAVLQGREAELLPLLGITGRAPLDREREYIAAWTDMGFPDETIRLAYEKTVFKKQSLNWAYMNSILKSWHQKGLHTPLQVEQGDSSPLHRETKTAVAAAKTQQFNRDMDDLFRD